MNFSLINFNIEHITIFLEDLILNLYIVYYIKPN